MPPGGCPCIGYCRSLSSLRSSPSPVSVFCPTCCKLICYLSQLTHSIRIILVNKWNYLSTVLLTRGTKRMRDKMNRLLLEPAKILLMVSRIQQGWAPKCLRGLMRKPTSAVSLRTLRSLDRLDLP